MIGAGVFGRFHAQKYASLPGVRLIGISDVDGARAMDAASAHGVGAFPRVADLLAEVDIVSVATPAVTHAQLGLQCLEAGKHVYLEKPIAVEVSDAERMIGLAETRKLIFQIGHQERLVLGATGLTHRAVEPSLVECVRAGPFNGRATDVSVVLDLMIHDLDLVSQLTRAPVAAIKAVERGGPGGASDEVEAELTLTSGGKVKLLASRNATERRRTLRAVYADGEVNVDFLNTTFSNTTPDALVNIYAAQAMPAEVSDPVGGSVARFVAAVRGQGPVLVPPVEARRALELANGILAAARKSAGK